MNTILANPAKFPRHTLRSRGNKIHAIPIEDNPYYHRASRCCDCNPKARGQVDSWGHGVWIHQHKDRP